ncbi:MAG: N-formylglutamate amidohydrolase [Hyphomicrobiales bacterium]|nr:N-formylglutamate amidohydrolase [Hyphomicrobiales bacterium]
MTAPDASDGPLPARPAPDLLPPDLDSGPVVQWMPAVQTAPLVLASPHSGRRYPRAFLQSSRLDTVGLRRSEDAFVEELFADAPALGVPLVAATFPRAYVDANREPFELDPTMFEDRPPAYANVTSPRVAAGLGTIPRVVAGGAEIYAGKLRFAEARRRVDTCYTPYHDALKRLVDATRARFGACLLVDCHSMPSPDAVPGPAARPRAGSARGEADVVLGDCHGTSCAPAITDLAERTLRGMGLVVIRNAPYAGGYTTRHYSRPSAGVHTLQIEVSRALYMDEARVTRGPGLPALRRQLRALVRRLAALAPSDLRPDGAA